VASLAEEARYLHDCLFAIPLDPLVVQRYEAAHLQAALANPECLPDPSVVTKIVTKELDAEAVEFALRRRGQGRELTRKMQTLCYLVEVRPAYLVQFVNLESSRSGAWAALIGATIGSAWKLLKGEYLVRRHGLV
jgi:hypothetical protein